MQHELSALIPYFVNFAIIVIGLGFAISKPFSRFVYQRHEHIRDLVESAKKEKLLIEAKMKELESGLTHLRATSEKMLNDERAAATAEALQIADKSRQEAARIEADADRIIENELREGELKVKAIFVNQVIADAESKLQKDLKREDHAHLVKRASGTIEVGA